MNSVQRRQTRYFSGDLRSEETYVNGVLHGEYKEWHENGQLSVEGWYEYGEECGEWKHWFSDGRRVPHIDEYSIFDVDTDEDEGGDGCEIDEIEESEESD